MRQLQAELTQLMHETKGNSDTINLILSETPTFPFSREASLLAYFLSIHELSFDKYTQIKKDYGMRNQYLYLFDMAPRTYGQTWGEKHIRNLFPQFVKATKDNLADVYPSFSGEFDLWLEGIRIEVKACRANSTKTEGSLASRAYLHSEAKAAGFKYHYQQLKPSCCDVFIWIGTCRDELIYWVLTSDELQQTGKLGSQHRNENTGIVGTTIFEGQIFMAEEELAHFQVSESDILDVVRQKGQQVKGT